MSTLMSSVTLMAGGLVVGAMAMLGASGGGGGIAGGGKALKSVTINTNAYGVEPKQIDRRSVNITAEEDMHIVGIEHFNGVQRGAWSDNGHILSLNPDNPWTKYATGGTGMEPTGEKGYFGYCGRDYYSEVGGIGDVGQFEMFPAGTYVLVPAGKKLHMHCYANNFTDGPRMFHHAVRILYW